MTNKETIERWAEFIIPAVFKAEDDLLKAKPEWKERLRRLREPGGEPAGTVVEEYCREIATIIVKQGSDYEPDGSIYGENDYIENDQFPPHWGEAPKD